MKDPHKPFGSWLHLGGLKSLSRDNYEGSTQAFGVLAAFRGAQILMTGQLCRIHTSRVRVLAAF